MLEMNVSRRHCAYPRHSEEKRHSLSSVRSLCKHDHAERHGEGEA